MSAHRVGRPASLRDPRLLLASACFIGFVPLAEGTSASAVALLLGLAVQWWVPQPTLVLGAAIVLAAAAGFALAPWAEREAGVRDPGWFVLDEVAGMWVAMWWMPGGWLGGVTAFVAFRVLDIAKPPPIRQTEKLAGPAGIMFDDLTAGVLANVAVRLAWLVAG